MTDRLNKDELNSDLVAKYLAKQIAETDSENRLIKKVSAYTALIAAFATLLGAATSVISANSANNTAEGMRELLDAKKSSEFRIARREETLRY